MAQPYRVYRGQGGVRAVVWRNFKKSAEVDETEQDPQEFYTVVVERGFKRDENSEWENSNSFMVRHLPAVLLVVQEALRDLALKVQD